MHEALVDLADRWRRARDAALRPLAPEGTPNDELISAALGEQAEEAQRRVFDNSLRLGRGFARAYGVALTLEQLEAALGSLGVPCLHGVVRACEDEEAFTLERDGCPMAARGPGACDLLREAVYGLVLGITGGIRHTRHRSVGHGDARCVDFFHVDPESPRRFGPIPDDMREGLDSVCRIARAFDSTTEVTFLGVSEGVLIYRIDRREQQGNVSVKELVERTVRRKLPTLSLQEISPRPVFDAAE